MSDQLPTGRLYLARYVRRVVEAYGWNKREAGRVLKMSYHTINVYLDLTGSRTRPPVVVAVEDPEIDALIDITAKQLAELDAVKVLQDALQ